MVYRTCLENKSLARDREFESHPLRFARNAEFPATRLAGPGPFGGKSHPLRLSGKVVC